MVDLVQRWQLLPFLEEHIAVDPPRQRDTGLMFDEPTCGDGENVVQLLQGPLFSLRYEEENKEECNDVETPVPQG